MANCHELFQQYIEEISILSGKRQRLMKSKDALRKKIVKYFKEHHPEYEPKFFIQGSYKSGTGIRNNDDMCDLDDGVYFLRKPDISATTLQKWVYEAVEGHTEWGQEHRKKCIRVIYAGDYHIDLPVYYKIDNKHPFLAVKNTGWEESDPKEFVIWYNKQKDIKGQLIRITKDTKGWCDEKEKNHKMPSGLCMTVLVAHNIAYNDRDDLCLRDTLKKIQQAIDDTRFPQAIWQCKMPTTPGDDLFKKYDDILKKNFLNCLNQFIADAENAIKENNEMKASRLWRKHLGNRFPLGKDKDTSEGSQAEKLREAIYSLSSFGNALINRNGQITRNDIGMKSIVHRNHGDE